MQPAKKKPSVNKAPLVETDINELGDKRLNPEEAVARERESLLALCETKKIAGQAQLENPERSAGPRIYWRELLRRLQKISPELRPKDSSVGGTKTIALYFPKTVAEKLADGSNFMVCVDERDRFHVRDYKYVGGFNKEYLPFYSHVTLDSSKLPVREVRGVMTVLLMLIRAKAVTLEQVCKEFGDPSEDTRSNRFMEQTAEFRN